MMATAVTFETPSAIIEQHIIESIAEVPTSTMDAPSAVPPQPTVTIYGRNPADPFNQAWQQISEYYDKALQYANGFKTTFCDKFGNLLPEWMTYYIIAATCMAFKLGSLVFVLCFVGVLGYETSFNVFKILGLITPEQLSLIKADKVKLAEGLEKMTYDEKKKKELAIEKKDALNKEIERGGTFIWSCSAAWVIARVFWLDNSFAYKLLWALAETVVVLNIAPFAAALLLRWLVVPKAYDGNSWLSDGEVVAAIKTDGVKTAKDAAPPSYPASNQMRGPRIVDLDDQSQTTEYANEGKRVGFSRRAARASAKGGLDRTGYLNDD